MKENTIVIICDGEGKTQIGKPNGPDGADPWEDLATAMEGVGVLARACLNAGIKKHKGKPLKKYLQWYIGEVCDDYKRTMSIQK